MPKAVLLSLLAAVAPAACASPDPEPAASASPASDRVRSPVVPSSTREEPKLTSYVGVVVASQAVDVAPREPARVLEVLVRSGDHVEAGQAIATLDPRPVREEISMAAARLRSLRSDEAAAELAVQAAQRTLEDEQRLGESGVSSSAAVREAKLALRQAQAQHQRTRAAVGEQQARMTRHRRSLTETTLEAPFSGRIGQLHRSPGATTGPTMPIARLIGTQAPIVRFAIPAPQAQALHLNTPLRVQIETLPHPLPARITEIAPQLDPASRQIFIDATLDTDLVAHLRPGLAAEVHIDAR